MIEAMFNNVAVDVQFLKAIRDHHNNIIDFEYVPLKKEDFGPAGRKTFQNSHAGNHQLFEQLKQLVETGVAFQSGYFGVRDDQQASLRFTKFGDGILISGNNGDSKQQNNDIGEEQKPVPGTAKVIELKPPEKSKEPEETLLKRNKELEVLNAELKAINSVASIEYNETIQKLYTNLEYIVSTNAKVLNDASKANIRRAQSTIQRMKLFSDDVNHFLQLYEFGIHKTYIDPNPVLDNVISAIKGRIEQTGALIELVKLPFILADPLLLSILFTRLIENSIKFRKLIAQPMIRIKYSKADEMNAVPAAIKDTPYIIISVSDNGIGFPDEEAERIFELFFRGHNNEKYKGSGIGLSICKKIMTMHDGFITAEGFPANGAVFNCYFPLNK